MKIKNIVIPLIIIGASLSCLGVYLITPQSSKWAITSLVEVPACTARVADRLGIQHDFITVKDYALHSLKPGMTPEEVEKTLSKVGPIEEGKTYVDNEQDTNTQLVVKLCDNPFGNIFLTLYYSKDGHLINVVDPNDN